MFNIIKLAKKKPIVKNKIQVYREPIPKKRYIYHATAVGQRQDNYFSDRKESMKNTSASMLNQEDKYYLTDLISLESLQKLQDGFANSYNIPTLIYEPGGNPITEPSRFTEFCALARSTEKGKQNCMNADAQLVRLVAKTKKAQIRHSCVVQDIITAAAPIVVEGRHLANFGIGQITNKNLNTHEIKEYAKKIGLNENKLLKAAESLIPFESKSLNAAVQFISKLAELISSQAEEKLKQIRLMNQQAATEQKLRQANQKFNNAFYSANIATCMISTESRLLDANEEMCRLFGYTKEELKEKTMAEVTHPDDREISLQHVQKILNEDGAEIKISKRYLHKNGSVIYAEISSKLIKDDGEAPYFLTYINDRTDKMRLENERKKQLKFARALNEIAEIIIKNDNTDELLSNANRILGETLEADRSLIYHVSFPKNIITGLCEWLGTEHEDIQETKGVYSLNHFKQPFKKILETKKHLSSHFDSIQEDFLKDGSGLMLHESFKIKSLIWYPFAFEKDSFYVFTLNQILHKKQWTNAEIEFIESVAKQVNLALIKIDFLKKTQETSKFLEIKNKELEHAKKHAEQNEALFRNLFEYSPVSIWQEDLSVIKTKLEIKKKEVGSLETYLNNHPKFVQTLANDVLIKNVNQATVKLFKANSKEDLIVRLGDTFNEKSFDVFKKLLLSIAKGGLTFTKETEYQTLDGETVNAIIQVVSSGSSTNSLVSITDISQLKEATKSLVKAKNTAEASETKFRNIMEQIDEMIFLCDLNGKITYTSPASLRIFGYSPAEMQGNHFHDYLPKPEIEKALNAFGSAIATGKPATNLQFIMKRKAGSTFYGELSGRKYEIPGFTGAIGVIRDISQRKQAEEALHKSEEKFRYVLNNSVATIYNLNLKTASYDYLSPAVEDMYGYNAEEFIKEGLALSAKCIHPDDLFKIKDHVNKLINRKLEDFERTLEYRFKHPRKGYRWISENRTVIYDQQGKPESLIGNAIDITIRKEAEAKLRESEELSRKLIATVPDIIIRTNLNGEIVFVNDAISKAFPFLNKEDVLGHNMMDFIADKDKEIVAGNTRLMFEQALGLKEYQMHVGDGVLFEISVNGDVLRNAKNEPTGMVFVLRNVTERKKSERELIKLSTAVEQSPAVVVITDLDGNIEYANPKFSELTGYQTEEVFKQNARIMKSGHFSPDTYVDLWETITKGDEWHGEFHNKKKNGELFWEKASISPIRNKEGKIINYIKVSEDISEMKQKEQELRDALEKAKESDRLKSAFLSNMSHEIRTPMNGILGFTQLLKEPQLTGDEQESYINIIEKSGQRMLNTINDIIDISRIESGQEEVVSTEFNVNKILNDQFEFFQPEAKKKGIELTSHTSLTAAEANILSDKHKLEGILINLIKNAIKFTDHGTINFGCTISHDHKKLDFYVRDTGIGIPANRINAIFNRFEQADIEDSRVYEGSGLGLAISKAYAEMLGGSIQVESKEGKGTVFQFTIDYHRQHIEKKHLKPTLAKNPSPAFQNINILIAEDEETSIMLFKTIFKKEMDKITAVPNGRKCINFLKQHPETDIILLDIKMPDMNGCQAAKSIRDFNKDVIIIAQTAYGMFDDRKKVLEAGCNEYITKPIKKEELFEMMQQLIERNKK